ncbi:MAG: hypothetical protein V1921_04230 [Candidatus Altiarchaeota archaeon]
MRKAQASTEYLVILAVVIIIALVVVAVLGGFIDIGRGADAQAAKSYWRIADIGLVDWNQDATTLTVVARNNQDYKIAISAISPDGGVTNSSANSGPIQPGGTKTFTITKSCSSGDTYSYPMTVYYNDTQHGINSKIFTGAKDVIGTC